MKQPMTWIVLANGEEVAIYRYEGRSADPVPLPRESFHAPPRAEFADEQGRSKSRMSTSMHRMAPHSGPDPELARFAGQIVEHLEEALRKGRFERLVLAAGPKVLGMIRSEMSDALAKSVCAELDKDLTQYTDRKLRDYLEDKVPAAL